MFVVPSNDILEINEKCCKAKPNANRCFPIHVGLTSHIQPQLSRLCRKTCRTLTSQNADGSSPQSGFERHVNQKILHIRLFLSLGSYLSLLRMNAMKHNYIVIERTPLSLFHINNILITWDMKKFEHDLFKSNCYIFIILGLQQLCLYWYISTVSNGSFT